MHTHILAYSHYLFSGSSSHTCGDSLEEEEEEGEGRRRREEEEEVVGENKRVD